MKSLFPISKKLKFDKKSLFLILGGIILIGIVFSQTKAQKICYPENYSGNDKQKIQRAIDDCENGGEVILENGKTYYISGSLTLKKGITFNLNRATLSMTGRNIDDYQKPADAPWTQRRVWIRTPKGVSNLKIIGPGLFKKTKETPDLQYCGPENMEDWPNISMLHIAGGSNVEIENITIDSQESPEYQIGFHLQLTGGEEITIKNVTVRSRKNGATGNDGIHIGKRLPDLIPKNILVQNCEVDVIDDAFVTPSRGENIRVKNCKFNSRAAASIKLNGGRNIVIEDVELSNSREGTSYTAFDGRTAISFAFRSGPDYDVGPILLKNVKVDSTAYALFRYWKDITSEDIHDLSFENFEVFGGGEARSRKKGAPWRMNLVENMKRVTFKNIHFHSGESAPLVVFKNICGLSISGFSSTLTSDPQSDLSFRSVTNLVFDGSSPVCEEDSLPCSCSSWQNDGCGKGSCPKDKLRQTRTCSPSGCNLEERCITDPSCRISADFNQDGKVDLKDLGILFSFWLRTDKENCDLNKDGTIDEKDFAILLSQWK